MATQAGWTRADELLLRRNRNARISGILGCPPGAAGRRESTVRQIPASTGGRYKAKAAGIKAGNRYPNLSPAEIRMQDEVMRADIAFEEIREKLEPELTDLEARIHKAHEIAMR